MSPDRRARALLFCCVLGCRPAAAHVAAPGAPAPAEPHIAFSHKTHASDNQIGCGVCHPYARHSPNAGLAPASVCMGCHKFVARDKPDIRTLAGEFAAGRPMQWTRVHRVPDHVFFSHERHLAASPLTAGLDCKSCHGDVAAMGLAQKARDLEMGSCLDCHRQRQAPVDCLTCHK